MPLNSVAYIANFCGLCIEAAKQHCDEDGKEDGYLVEENRDMNISNNRSYFLIKWLEAAPEDDRAIPNHKCEAPQVCDCSHYHEDEEEEEDDAVQPVDEDK